MDSVHTLRMACPLEAKLLQEWVTAARQLTMAVNTLSGSAAHSTPLRKFWQLKTDVATARLVVEHARAALTMHRDEHGC
jgi:hypothetical protein